MSFEMEPFDRSRASSYSSAIAAMTLSCIIRKKRDNGRTSRFCYTPSTQPPSGKNGCEYFSAVFIAAEPDLSAIKCK